MQTRRFRYWLPIALFISSAANLAAAQQKLLTIDDIYDTDKRVNFTGTPASGFTWIDATHYAWPKSSNGNRSSVDWTRVDAVSGNGQPLFDAAKMEAAFAKVPGVAADEARRVPHARNLTFNTKYTAALTSIADDLYLYTFATGQVTRLTYETGVEEEVSFSPDDRLVAYIRGNNLYTVEVANPREVALTTDGTPKILNGRLDWVYEEEIYGRGLHRAYWWSPDSSRIAFLRLDDTPVPTFTVVDHIPYELNVERRDYPKAGDPNPIATLGVVRAGGGAAGWVDTRKYSAADHLIVGVSWTPDSRRVVYEVQDRTQTWMDLDIAETGTLDSRTLFRETSQAWVNPKDGAEPVWLEDGSFLWLSERTGWQHLYHYNVDGTLVKQVTDGLWEFRTLHGVDEAAGWIYFSGTERSPIGEDVYRVRLDGTGLQRLSKSEGTHSAKFSPALAFFIDSWSDITTPTKVALLRNDGSSVRTIDENTVAALGGYRLSKPEFVQVKTRDGFVMEAMMIKPPDFDPSRRYPVFQFTYGGPHAPQVRNVFGGQMHMFLQLIAQKGIVVWVCDNRTASGKGIESTWPVYKHFGELELRDIEDGLSWLKQQPYVDGSRIGIHGWSYGGFMTSYALTHSTSFAMGIAGGTVADWRDYDSVYTERYMGLPQDNPEGYRKSSPRWAAKDLHGALMLIHGAIDDNVHMQNTLQFAYELQKAEKPFQLMLYPKSRHGVTDPLLVKHMRSMMLDFIVEHLAQGIQNAK